MSGKYDGLGLYHDPADPRLFVPKPIPMAGWTVNASHRNAPIILIALGVVVGLAIARVLTA